MTTLRFTAPTSRGTEAALAQELASLGLGDPEVGRGVVRFAGPLADGYRACLWSRLASRVLLEVGTFDAPDADALYSGVAAIDWTEQLRRGNTLAVDVVGTSATLRHSGFSARKVKDAVVDRLRDRAGWRPDVDLKAPDLRLHLYLDQARATLSIDLAGAPLHERGGGRAAGEAPLKENLAAAILRIARWPAVADGGGALVDPFCGSGTFLAEAAGLALDRAPGLGRRRWGFQGWAGHDGRTWERLLREAQDRARAGSGRPLRLVGSDLDAVALKAARDNLARLGLEGRATLLRQDARNAVPAGDKGGLVVANPPYGARLGAEAPLAPLYQSLGDVLRHRFLGWTAWIFTGNPALARAVGLRPARRHVLFNGPIECRLLEIPIADAAPTSDRGPGWRRPRDA